MSLTRSQVLKDASKLPPDVVTANLAAALRGPSYAPEIATCGPFTLYVLRTPVRGRWHYRGYAVESSKVGWFAGDPDRPITFEEAASILCASYNYL